MNELKQIIIEEIRANGPMPLEDYMALSLIHISEPTRPY